MLETNNKIKFLVEIHWVTDIPKEQNIRRHRSKIKTLFPTLRCVFCSLQPLARIPESVFFLPATAISSSCYTRCTRETRTGFYGTSIDQETCRTEGVNPPESLGRHRRDIKCHIRGRCRRYIAWSETTREGSVLSSMAPWASCSALVN